MSNEIDTYKEFVDEVVSVRDSVTSKWIERGYYPKTNENEYRNKVLSSLSEEQRYEVSKIVQEAKESGIHDVLVFLNQQCSVTFHGLELPAEPFGTELNYDFVARSEGEDWPQHIKRTGYF